jgi:hypothetical protein
VIVARGYQMQFPQRERTVYWKPSGIISDDFEGTPAFEIGVEVLSLSIDEKISMWVSFDLISFTEIGWTRTVIAAP